VKKAQKLSHLKKGLLALMMRLWCSSGMEIRALAILALTMAAWAVHHPLTPPLFESLPPVHSHDDEEEGEGKEDDDDE
jgi:hypothetical protein